MSPKSYRRGYPVAILIGIEVDCAAIWHIFSQVAKQQQIIHLNGDRKDQKAVYSFHEAIINTIRSTLKEGVRSIVVASPPKTRYSQNFQNHIEAHHTWLIQGTNKATVSLISGSANTPPQVAALTKKPEFKQLIQENAAQETENLLEILEKRLNKTANIVLFSLEEVEGVILDGGQGKLQPEYVLLTDNYLAGSHQKGRLNRLIQIAQNKKVKTRVVAAESNAGVRLNQLGGIVCLLKED